MNINKGDTLLTFGFTAGTLFDMKEAETIFEASSEEERHNRYREYFARMNARGEVFKPGPALGMYIALQGLRAKIPEDLIKLRFGLTARFDTNHEGAITLANSLEHYFLKDGKDLLPDYCSLTGYLEQSSSHKVKNADVVFTSSDSSAKEYHNSGIAAIHIPNISELQNMKMYNNRDEKINFIFDFDGVVVDHGSEIVYQAAKQIEGVDPIKAFNMNEIENRNIPMQLGPLGLFLQKASLIVAHYQKQILQNEIKPEDVPFETRIMTARGGGAVLRVLKTLTYYNIQVSRADFEDGSPKYIALGMLDENAINLFMEDSFVHVDGARRNANHVMAGLVFNDYTSGRVCLEETVAKLRQKKAQS